MEDVEAEIFKGAKSIGILGLTPVTFKLVAALKHLGFLGLVTAVYADRPADEVSGSSGVAYRKIQDLRNCCLDVLVVAADREKQRLLNEALAFINGCPKVVVAGYAHLDFDDQIFREELSQLLVPSLANGYPNSLVHLYQCLVNAARLRLDGVVAEFGMFKGGTTMFLSRVSERLGMNWRVIGFDTFAGFPARRSPLDMYDHPDCVFHDLVSVQRYLSGRNVEIVPGDIVQTCCRLEREDLVLTFMDTDNFTPAKAAIDVVRDRTVIHGCVVFDHFTGVDRFRYTLGERMAGAVLLDDQRYFNLHGTGVFIRQR